MKTTRAYERFGYSFIELLIAVAILGGALVPLLWSYRQARLAAAQARLLEQATRLAQQEMERLKNDLHMGVRLALETAPKPTMTAEGFWVLRRVDPESKPSSVIIQAGRHGNPRPIAELFTLVEDLSWR